MSWKMCATCPELVSHNGEGIPRCQRCIEEDKIFSHNQALAKIEKLYDKIERLEKALELYKKQCEFYADKGSWRKQNQNNRTITAKEDIDYMDGNWYQQGGKLARETIKQVNELMGEK